MKKFLLFTTLCLMFVAGKAQINSMTDLFGEYTFTSEMTVTTDGEKFFKAGRFAQESDVVITSNNTYPAQVTGIAGAKGGIIGIQDLDVANKTFGTANTNTNAPWVAATIGMTTPDGANPWNGGYYLEFTYDANGNITIPNFALVRVTDYNAAQGTILAQFTNCKLTLKEKEVIVLEDMSGNWTFDGTGFHDVESQFPTTFQMDITANNTEFNEYTVDILYEGYDKLTFDKAVFDGETLSLPINNTYLSTDEKIVLYTYMYNREGVITFKKGTTNNAMTLSSGMRLAQETNIEGKDTIVGLQSYSFGYAKKNVVVEASEFEGLYTVTTGKQTVVSSNVYPKSFDIEIKSDGAGGYLVTKFFGQSVVSINDGGIPAAVSEKDPTKLEISVGTGSKLKDLGNGSYIVLYDNTGSDKGKVTITIAADGNVTMSEFTTSVYDGSSSKLDAMFQTNAIVKGDLPSPIDFSQVYTVKLDESKVEILNPIVEIPAEWEIKFTDYKEYGVYLNSFLGENIGTSLNQGGFMVEVDENDVRTLNIDLSGNRYLKSVEQGVQYLLVCNAKGENSGELNITIDPQGNVTVSDFTVVLSNITTGESTIVARYGDTEVEETSVDSVKEAVISAANGVITVAEEALVEVYSVTGVLVYSDVTTEVSGLARGIYIVKVGTTVRRIIL
ncbi:MAG: T9SS type A sorting domain-containing protein [Bacteroidaceae bacterium]|nr:T9SS type A sorting domain-containing protein [Bacteroidaceae bacterium]